MMHRGVAKIWDHISDSAKDLVTRMLTYNPEERISAADAYKHKWLQSKEFSKLDPEKTQELISNMSKFYVKLHDKTW